MTPQRISEFLASRKAELLMTVPIKSVRSHNDDSLSGPSLFSVCICSLPFHFSFFSQRLIKHHLIVRQLLHSTGKKEHETNEATANIMKRFVHALLAGRQRHQGDKQK